MIQNDYILRTVQQLGQALARMLGLQEDGAYSAALHAADEAYDLLGVPRVLADQMDVVALGELVRDPVRLCLLAQLARREGEILDAAGKAGEALGRYRRALDLAREARERERRSDVTGDHAAPVEVSGVVIDASVQVQQLTAILTRDAPS